MPSAAFPHLINSFSSFTEEEITADVVLVTSALHGCFIWHCASNTMHSLMTFISILANRSQEGILTGCLSVCPALLVLRAACLRQYQVHCQEGSRGNQQLITRSDVNALLEETGSAQECQV